MGDILPRNSDLVYGGVSLYTDGQCEHWKELQKILNHIRLTTCRSVNTSQPSECGRQRTLNIVHAQTAAQQQSNGSYEARMSGKCGEWRD